MNDKDTKNTKKDDATASEAEVGSTIGSVDDFDYYCDCHPDYNSESMYDENRCASCDRPYKPNR